MFHHGQISLCLLVLTCSLAASQESSQPRVLAYLPPTETSPGRFVVSLGALPGVEQGSLLEASRPTVEQLVEGPHLASGRLRVVSLGPSNCLVEELPSADSQGVRVNDDIRLVPLDVRRQSFLAQTHSWTFRELFEQPHASASQLELSRGGRQALQQACLTLAPARVGLVLIRGHVDLDSNLGRQKEYIESLQRAQVVRQYVLEECGLKRERVVALGLGAWETTDARRPPTGGDLSRRIEVSLHP